MDIKKQKEKTVEDEKEKHLNQFKSTFSSSQRSNNDDGQFDQKPLTYIFGLIKNQISVFPTLHCFCSL
jgi:hypothetical protein